MLRRIRIPVQLACLALFFYLLLRTVGIGQDRLGPPVRIFLEIDPLVGLTTLLRTGLLPGLLGLSLITLAAAFLLGRSFCGWVCPLGTLSQIVGRLFRRRREEKSPDRWRPVQRWKFFLLLFVTAGALAGTLWSGLLDPLCILIRGLAVGLGPAAEWTVRACARGLAATPLSPASEPLYRWLRDRTLAPAAPHFEEGLLFACLLLVLLGLSWAIRRFWCRALCPLGGLLGTFAQAGALKLRQTDARCTSCGLCTFHCQGAADPDRMGGWRASECFVCGNCTSACNRNGLSFALETPRLFSFIAGKRRRNETTVAEEAAPAARAQGHEEHKGRPDLGRRGFLLATGLGLISGPLGRVSPARAHPRGNLIRPPGAASEEVFLSRCVRCGECMKVCPGNGLHPAGSEAGLAGLWTPVLRSRLGYCEYHCTLCGQVCPTGAIPRLSPAEKEKAVLGLAYVDVSRCLPYAYATPCIVCEEHCPTSPKAIWLEETTVLTTDGTVRTVRRPHVSPSLCVGCGICEFRCPMEGEGAIRVAATGRTGQGGPFDLGGDSPYPG
jgi:polyferredoxin